MPSLNGGGVTDGGVADDQLDRVCPGRYDKEGEVESVADHRVMDSQPLAQSRLRVGRMGVARPLARW